jgi:hypothetical protein
MANGLNLLGTYTYSHSLDDSPPPLGSTGDGGYRNTNLLPIRYDYSNSAWDTRHRVTFNGYYDLPFGKGRPWLNRGGVANEVAEGWASQPHVHGADREPAYGVPEHLHRIGGEARGRFQSPIHSRREVLHRPRILGSPARRRRKPSPTGITRAPSPIRCLARKSPRL